MKYLKQSTAVVIPMGPFVAVADGATLLTDSTTITDIDHATTGIFLIKNGSAGAIRHATVTASVADAYGMMLVTLDATDTGTLGRLRVCFAKAARYLPVWEDFTVLPANMFDSIVSGSDLIDVSVTQWLGTAVSTPTVAGVPNVNTKTWNDLSAVALPLVPTTAGRTLDVSATGEAGVDWANVGSPTTTVGLSGTTVGVVTAVTGLTASDVGAIKTQTDKLAFTVTNQVDANVITKTGFALSSGGIQAIWDALTSALTATGSIGKWILDKLDVAVSTRGTGSGTALDAAGVRSAVGLASANLDTQLDALPTNAELATALAAADDATLAAIAALNNLSAAGVRAAVGLATANLDTQLDAIPTNTDLATALGTADDATLAAIAALNNLSQANIRTAVGLATANLDTQLATLATTGAAMTLTSGERNSIADALLDRANGVEASLTPRQGMRLMVAAMAGLVSGGGTTTVVIRNTPNTKDRITATVDGSGNRSAITYDLT